MSRGAHLAAALVALTPACGGRTGILVSGDADGDAYEAGEDASIPDVLIVPDDAGDAGASNGEGDGHAGDGEVDACHLLAPQDAAQDAPQCVGGSNGACCSASFQAPQQFCIQIACGGGVLTRVETTPPECICGDTYDCACIAAHFSVTCGGYPGPFCFGGGAEGVVIQCSGPAC